MRIGLIAHHTFGGSSKIATAVGRHMAARGHHVSLFARDRPPSLERGDGVRFHGIPMKREVTQLEARWPAVEREAMVARIQRVAASEGLDVLHAHFALPHTDIALEARRRIRDDKPAILTTLHGSDVSLFGVDPEHGPRLARELSEVDAVTTVSRSHADLAERTLGLSPAPLVIPNFVDVDRFRPAETNRGSRPRIVHASNFRAVKDPELLAEIFVRVRTLLDSELWLVGEGDGLEVIRERLAAAGALDDARFLGGRADVEHVLPQAHVMLLTSKAESFSLAALEAAACGLPVVAPRLGGLPESVVHEVTGLLFPPGDAAAAADALAGLLRDPVRSALMGRAGVSWARRFSPERAADLYEALYRKLGGGEG